MKLPVVTGSHALQYYGLLKGRIPADWDLIMERPKACVKTQEGTFDISDANSLEEPTNRIIFDKSQSGPRIKTPLGEAVVIPLSLLKVMKMSSIPLNKVKNLEDLKSLEDVDLTTEEVLLVSKRLNETHKKIESQKSKFFNKYSIPRFMDHDELHLLINPAPVYKQAISSNSAVEINEELFLKLSLDDQKKIFWEESFVLSLERWLIPNVRNYPMMVDAYCESFFRVEKTSDPSLYWLGRLCNPGVVKDHPEWLAKWGQSNYNVLLQGYDQWWESSFDSIDKSFWLKLLKF